MSAIFGGSKSKQSSNNKAYDGVNSSLSPVMNGAAGAFSKVGDLLSGDTSGFDAYKDATGFNFEAEQGSRGITGNAAARGLLRSGGTGKALVNYGNDLQQKYAGNYMDRLTGQVNSGLQAGQVITSAGQQSSGTSKSKPGIGKFLGQVGAGIAMSDRRLKTNIHKVGELPNGLGLYQYRYNDGSGPFLGVMADEVAAIQPEALGPVIDGYQSVDYDKIEQE
jgi:hypothetical protein